MQYGTGVTPQVFVPPQPSVLNPQPGVDWITPASSSYAPDSSAYPSYGGVGTSGHGVYGSFEDEAPLLEELGIDIPAIINRTAAILTMRLSKESLESLDLGGPLIFMALLGFAHLLVGKLHFGYILGWTVVGSGLIWFVLNSMTGRSLAAIGLGVAAVFWSAGTAAKLFTKRSPALRGQTSVIMYPATLMYTAFALLTLY
ncbi:Protein YIPF5 [Auxenochlorella protothecoides]|uniref:Protein YIPF5 n=2 Tax=Auxenochlorella protothecoides TaxID=3075 RepID=A0A087SIS6_AUXPR|nr:Protein YIPF5 [Auxenochlorella protothecoides]KFM25630.1 Protein YIPF5 [Auxenochlorella protothecoides]